MSTDAETPLCGPAELLGKLLDGREAGRHSRPEVYGDISDEGVRRLVILSYFTSQAAEEGHYPKFRVVVSPRTNLPPGLEDPWRLLAFGHPVPVKEVDDLRRLAPTASSHDFALEVRETNASEGIRALSCVGLRMAHSGEAGAELLSTSIWARHVRPGLMVRVDGPGELRVSEAMRALDLRASKLVDLGGFPTHPLQIWADSLASRLALKERQEKALAHTIHFAWNELVGLTAERGRGGCLVVLPDTGLSADEVEGDYPIRLKYPCNQLNLGRLLAEFVDACSPRVDRADFDAFKAIADAWMKKRFSLLAHVKTLANLCGVDGCMVFDADLRLLGFGGKISAAGDESKKFRDARSNLWLNPDVMSKTGTRHLSAFRLCQSCPGVWCYVVSQDGHVTLFWSDAKEVRRWAPYWPWAKRSDHF
jgi:hypothetical protein